MTRIDFWCLTLLTFFDVGEDSVDDLLYQKSRLCVDEKSMDRLFIEKLTFCLMTLYL